jgi:hypothetical protein
LASEKEIAMIDEPKKKWSTGKIIIVAIVGVVLIAVVIPCLIGMLMPATPSGTP